MQIHHYQNILAENLYLYTSGNSFYPATPITEHERKVALNIGCTQYAFHGPGIDADYNALFEECSEYLCRLFFFEKPMNYYLFLLDKKSKEGTVCILNHNNFREEIHYLVDSRTCFVISSPQDLLNKEFTENVIKKFLLPGSYISINYLKLVLSLLEPETTIYKMSGDGADNYIAIDAFSKVH
ncbi:hypothetical protein [Dyadobacter aurulentus]|uniref:hypothetical protein n=1 Tax=Dyadobacter sp. UC 10 TaxID=2605428 RepID=UPI0011F29055|nr:hypothetical protein [Dyadobacter sp. UC 10]KAA0990017.1 hypothetical protein FXO21_07515 [Dyadobacter sp. UC 10]